MAVQCNKLWKVPIEKKMSKADLRRMADISSNTMPKLNRDEIVALPILDTIWETLSVDHGVIQEAIIVIIANDKAKAKGCVQNARQF